MIFSIFQTSTLFPIKELSEKLGGKVTYEPEGKKGMILVETEFTEALLQIGKNEVIINGHEVPVRHEQYPIYTDCVGEEDGYQLLLPFEIVHEYFGLNLKTMARAVVAGSEPGKDILKNLTEKSIKRRIEADKETKAYMQDTSNFYEKTGTPFEEDGKKLVEILVDKYEFMSSDRAMAYYQREGIFNPESSEMQLSIYEGSVFIKLMCFGPAEKGRLKFILSKVMTDNEAKQLYMTVNNFAAANDESILKNMKKLGSKSIKMLYSAMYGSLIIHIKDPKLKINLN